MDALNGVDAFIGNVTLEQVAEMYAWAGIRKMSVFPWYEDGELVALVTGWIEWGGFGFSGEKVGFLEHFIVKPTARRKLEVMNLLPSFIADVCRDMGVHRLVLCIHHKHNQRARLEKWALHRGYTKYGIGEFADWYSLSLKEQHDGQVHPSPEDSGRAAGAEADRSQRAERAGGAPVPGAVREGIHVNDLPERPGHPRQQRFLGSV